MDFAGHIAVLLVGCAWLAHHYNKNPHGFLAGRSRSQRPQSQPKRLQPRTEVNEAFLDRLEIKHGHEAQKALAAANNNDAPGALRWYSAALATAEMLYGCTQDRLWRDAIASYRSLVTDYTRMVTTRRAVAVQRVPTTTTSVPSMPAPVAPVTPADPREALISKLIHQLHCDRATAESIADRQLAQVGRP